MLNLFQPYFAYALASRKNMIEEYYADQRVRKGEINGKPRSETCHSSEKESNTIDNA